MPIGKKLPIDLKTDEVAEHVAQIRVSLVFGKEAGIFSMYLNRLKANPHVVYETNNNAVSWNHVEDMAGIFAFAVTHHLNGIYNSVGPVPVSQQAILSGDIK